MTVAGLRHVMAGGLLRGLCLFGAATLAAPGEAQPAGASAKQASQAALRGRAYAREVCASCHAVEPGAPERQSSRARSFSDIAATPGMIPMALNVWFSTSHPSMPDLIIADSSKEDLYAYFEALRNAARPARAAD